LGSFFLQLNYRTKIYYTMTIILITLLAITLYLFIKMTNKYQETHDKYMGSLDKLDRLRSKTGYYGDVYSTKDS
jgi:preprotein translocase subunit YajC